MARRCSEEIRLVHHHPETMKSILYPIVLGATLVASPIAQASPEKAKAACGRCHDPVSDKKGPTYKTMSAKFKGDIAAAMNAIYDPKAEHPRVRVSKEEVEVVVKWMLTQ